MTKDRTTRFFRDVEGFALTIALIIFAVAIVTVFVNSRIAGHTLIAAVGFFLFGVFAAMIGDVIGYWRERLAKHREETWAAPEYLGELARVRPAIDVGEATPVSLAVFIMTHCDGFTVDQLTAILDEWRDEAVKPFIENWLQQ